MSKRKKNGTHPTTPANSGLKTVAAPQPSAPSQAASASSRAKGAPAPEAAPDETCLIAPWSWCFTRFSSALAATLAFSPALWLVLVAVRSGLYPGDPCYWNHEMTLVTAFTAAGAISLFLARLLGRLVANLSRMHPDMADFLGRLRDRFHDWRWLVPGPLLLGALAISIRYVTAGEFTPFASTHVDILFSVWLLVGFFFVLNATVLCGRYTELVKRIAHEIASGKLGRAETILLSRFYLNVAVLATIHFSFCVIIIYTMHLLYTYNGMMWPAYALLRWRPGLGLAGQIALLVKDPLFIEVVIFFGLLGLASLAPLLYFTYPQWEVHKLLDVRRRRLLDEAQKRLDEIETRLRPDSPEADFETFSRRRLIAQAIEEMPTWPFSGYGTAGTLLLIAMPGFLVLLKEVFLQAFVQLLFS
ncbi:MAG TPA: hypothetical protein PLU72_11825 [Candidatus Ozemobacteraceae bacterium]|nr:hypothetical protein [Candidatus Ozemobacteraceae bacterium]